MEWCAHATEYASATGGKPWKYALIPHDVINDNMTVAWGWRSVISAANAWLDGQVAGEKCITAENAQITIRDEPVIEICCMRDTRMFVVEGPEG